MASNAGFKLLKDYFAKFLQSGTGFDSCLNKVKLISGGGGQCVCEMTVEEEHLNRMGSLHGGLIATLVDVVTTVAHLSADPGQSPGASIELSVSYLKGVKLGEDILIDAKRLKVGRNLAFLEAVIKNKRTGELIATGKQTKFLGSGNSQL